MQTDLQRKYPDNPEIRVEIDGNYAIALIGNDLQEGYAKCVKVVQKENETLFQAEYRAKCLAVAILRNDYGTPMLDTKAYLKLDRFIKWIEFHFLPLPNYLKNYNK